MNLLFIFIISLIFTVFTTPFLIRYLTKIKVVDLPGNRRIHTAIIPRMGGLLIYLSAALTVVFLSDELDSIRLLMVAANIILMIGFFDDILGLSYMVKIWGQFLACLLVLIYLNQQYVELVYLDVAVPHPLDYIILIAFIVGGINAVNFMDGIDGLVSGFSILAFSVILSLSVFFGCDILILLSVSLIGSLLGFLKFNRFPAKIFLGDTGSLILGFFLITSSLFISVKMNKGVLDLTFPAILLAVPLTDAIRVIAGRMLRKKSPFLPDKTHLHHLILEVTGSQRLTVAIIDSYSVIFALIAIYYLTGSHTLPLILFAFFVVLLLFAEPVISFLNTYRKEIYKRKFWAGMWNRNNEIIQKSFIYLTSLALLLILILSIPNHNSMENNILWGLLITGLAFFLIAARNKNIYKGVDDIFIFMNIAAFFTITSLNHTLQSQVFEGSEAFNFISEMSYYILTFIIMIFLIADGTVFPLKKFKVSDMDYALLIFIFLTFFVDYLIPSHINQGFKIFILEALVIYLWYKLVVSFKEEIRSHMFYMSFAISFAILMRLLII
ncbi:MAG: undecaprenyl/decaprenyl-phosphate alpha-N-acetylglucosaminyl 1-phosphate transferase [Ignavibacteria bacterium]|nr:undecaprenyl/decaprenyl-phosphate alpha-N-acetylglucosaminyl 1-phosphate transferase [Ignavibacteria bacterium]MCU7498625.1 undecaprenyl/decaprenyl-phosphate alpha-N-acetylglucosaminyl 1-phosphate transferase [Ignavibacteria bacterium]MCU7512471.1 undecaprenyl/decaprenyl-phosphate alpha-N-acetylglucosaminyl 1-phosphate transferase [Ignavibacteria bacterium]MCU7520932.1 undecaprenyl/decaprenyl-phosphate alpha-N-acetylglucosaminyl 1-phosphate transferase [Ignavibacteria bacterium]MCU7523610.1 